MKEWMYWLIVVLLLLLIGTFTAFGQVQSVMTGCPPGTQTCTNIQGGFGDTLDMEDATSSEPCPGGTSDPAGACDVGACFFQETLGIVWWCTGAGWAPGGNSSSGGRFIHAHKTGGAQTIVDGDSIDGWTLQERSSIADFTINGGATAISILKEGVYLINGGVNVEVDSADDDCMTFSTTVDSQASSSAAAKAADSSDEYFFQSVFSMVTDISTVPATVTIDATECNGGSSVSVKSGSTWMNISIVSAVASGSALDTGPTPDCPNNTDVYQDGNGNCDTVAGDVTGQLSALVIGANNHDHIESNVTDLTHTTNTNTWCGTFETCDETDVGLTLSGSTTEVATISGTWTSGNCTEFDASGNVVDSGGVCGGGGGAPSFDSITNGTNLTATAMLVGTGAALGVAGSGTITANRTTCPVDEFIGGGSPAPACYAETLYPRLLGRAGGQTLIGGTAASNGLTLESTSDAAKGTINFLDQGVFGANLNGDTISGNTDFYSFLDGTDITAAGAGNYTVLNIEGTIHLGSVAGFETWTAFYNGTVFELDDATAAVFITPWTLQNSATYKRSVNQTYSIITQSYRDTPTYENAHSTAWATAAQSHQGFVSGAKIKTSSTGDITMASVGSFISYPLFDCASGTTCTETLHIDYQGLDTVTGGGAGTEVIDTRYTFWVEEDTVATTHIGLYTEVPIQVEPNSLTAGATFQITPSAGYIEMDAGGGVTSNATTAILAGVDGQLLTVANTDTGSDIITIKDGANTQMDGDFAMNPGDTISFIYDATETDWLETSRADNDSSDGGGVGSGSDTVIAMFADHAEDTANTFFGPFGFDGATAAAAEWDVDADLTITAMECKQHGDTTCIVGYTLQNSGSTATDATGNLDTQCSSINESQCDLSGSSSYSAGDGLSIKITAQLSCDSSVNGFGCIVRYSYD